MPADHSLKQFLFKHYAIIAATACVVTFVFFLILQFDWKVLIAIEGGIVSFTFAVQKQKLEEVQLFKELFKEFNTRYDLQNEALNRIYNKPHESPLTADEVDTLFNYFNLCGEEYLYFKQGFIYPEVWRAWQNGMKFFRKNPRIKNKWDEELKTESYYGINFDATPRT